MWWQQTLRHDTAWRLWAQRAVRTLAGLVLLVSACLKAYDTGRVALSTDASLTLTTVVIESVLSVALLSGSRHAVVWGATLMFFAIVSGISLFRALVGYDSCGCFGGLLHIHPWVTFTLDVVLSASCATVVCTGIRGRVSRRLLWGTALVCAPIVVAWGVARVHQGLVVLDPKSWIGEELAVRSAIHFEEETVDLTVGSWDMVLHSNGCEACHAAVRSILARGDVTRQLAIIEVTSNVHVSDVGPTSMQVVYGHLDSRRRWFVPTPTLVRLDGGRVTEVYDSETSICQMPSREDAETEHVRHP